MKLYGAEKWLENHPHKNCKVCDNRMRGDSRYVICESSEECRKAHRKAKKRREYYGDDGKGSEHHQKSKRANRRNHFKNRKRINEEQRKRHTPVVGPTVTRITPTQGAERIGWPRDKVYRYCKKKHPHPDLATKKYPNGRHIQTWPDKSERSDHGHYLVSVAHLDKIAAAGNGPDAAGTGVKPKSTTPGTAKRKLKPGPKGKSPEQKAKDRRFFDALESTGMNVPHLAREWHIDRDEAYEMYAREYAHRNRRKKKNNS